MRQLYRFRLVISRSTLIHSHLRVPRLSYTPGLIQKACMHFLRSIVPRRVLINNGTKEAVSYCIHLLWGVISLRNCYICIPSRNFCLSSRNKLKVIHIFGIALIPTMLSVPWKPTLALTPFNPIVHSHWNKILAHEGCSCLWKDALELSWGGPKWLKRLTRS